jgi:hypothetical protein
MSKMFVILVLNDSETSYFVIVDLEFFEKRKMHNQRIAF